MLENYFVVVSCRVVKTGDKCLRRLFSNLSLHGSDRFVVGSLTLCIDLSADISFAERNPTGTYYTHGTHTLTTNDCDGQQSAIEESSTLRHMFLDTKQR